MLRGVRGFTCGLGPGRRRCVKAAAVRRRRSVKAGVKVMFGSHIGAGFGSRTWLWLPGCREGGEPAVAVRGVGEPAVAVREGGEPAAAVRVKAPVKARLISQPAHSHHRCSRPDRDDHPSSRLTSRAPTEGPGEPDLTRAGTFVGCRYRPGSTPIPTTTGPPALSGRRRTWARHGRRCCWSRPTTRRQGPRPHRAAGRVRH